MPREGVIFVSKGWTILLVFVLLLASGVVVAKVHIGVGPVTIGRSEVQGVLTLKGQGNNFPIFPDEETLLDALRAGARHDEAAENAALDRAAARGAFIVRPGTKVRIFERRRPSPFWETVHVEIMDGGATGKTGWTLADVVDVVH